MLLGNPATATGMPPYNAKLAQATLLDFYGRAVSRAVTMGVDARICTFSDMYLPNSDPIEGRPWNAKELPRFPEDRAMGGL